MSTATTTPVEAVKKGHRRQRSVGNTYQPLREGSLFEHFFYVGVPPQKFKESSNTVPQPEILFQYPDDNVQLPFEVISFCFPEGILQRGLRKTDSLSDVNRVLYGSLQVLEKSTNSFVFLVTKDTDVFYGVCVRNEELLENVSSFLKTKGAKRHVQIKEQDARSRSNSASSSPAPEPNSMNSSEANSPQAPVSSSEEKHSPPAPLVRSDSMIIHEDEEAEEATQEIPVVSVTSPSESKKSPLSVSDVYSDKPHERKSDEVTRNQAQTIPPKPTGINAAISAIKRSVSSPTLVNEVTTSSPRSDNGKAHVLDRTSQMTAITERVYCFISRFPFFKLHYEVLYHLLARERLYMFEKMNEQHGSLKVPGVDESEFNSILKCYHTVPVPKPSEHVNFKLPGLIETLTFNCPESNEDDLITEWCLPSALRVLKLEHITTLIAAALTEHRIVIQCNTLGVLSSIVLGMIPLLRPYTWQGPLIPVLPSSLLEYLQAPVPYICGVLKLPTDMSALDDTVILRVDENEIIVPKDFEPLPKGKKLESDLKPFYTNLCNIIKARYHDPYRNTGEQVEIVKKMINCVWEYHKFLLETISPYLKPGMLEDTKKATEVLEEMPRGFREFSHHLFNTQLFSVYFYELMTQVNEEQEAAKAHYVQLEDKIKTFEQERKRALDQIALLQAEVRDYNDKIEALKTTQKSLFIADTSTIKRKGPNPYSKFIQSSLESLKKSYWNVKTS